MNVWGLLAGRAVQINRALENSSTLKVVKPVFDCRLRKKNPFHKEIYSLQFKFKPVMNESGYLSNRYIL